MAQLTLSQVYNIQMMKLPGYKYNRLFARGQNDVVPETRTLNNFTANRVEFKLSLARTHFFYQASRLWTALPDQNKSSRNKATIKKRSKTWVKTVIMI